MPEWIIMNCCYSSSEDHPLKAKAKMIWNIICGRPVAYHLVIGRAGAGLTFWHDDGAMAVNCIVEDMSIGVMVKHRPS